MAIRYNNEKGVFMTLDFSKGYARDTLQVASDNRNEQIDRWFKDRSIKAWKKCLVALYRYEEMTTRDISTLVHISMTVTYRRLKKQVLDSKVKAKLENNKFVWTLTNCGYDSVFKMYKSKSLPEFLFKGV